MTEEQKKAFLVGAGFENDGIMSNFNNLFIATLIVIIFLWFAWGLVSVYKGYASGNLSEKTLVSFVIRGITLILISMYIFNSK